MTAPSLSSICSSTGSVSGPPKWSVSAKLMATACPDATCTGPQWNITSPGAVVCADTDEATASMTAAAHTMFPALFIMSSLLLPLRSFSNQQVHDGSRWVAVDVVARDLFRWNGFDEPRHVELVAVDQVPCHERFQVRAIEAGRREVGNQQLPAGFGEREQTLGERLGDRIREVVVQPGGVDEVETANRRFSRDEIPHRGLDRFNAKVAVARAHFEQARGVGVERDESPDTPRSDRRRALHLAQVTCGHREDARLRPGEREIVDERGDVLATEPYPRARGPLAQARHDLPTERRSVRDCPVV